MKIAMAGSCFAQQLSRHLRARGFDVMDQEPSPPGLTPEERHPYIAIGRAYGCQMEAILFDVPLEVCLERNRQRGRVVPEDAIYKMAAKLQPPSLMEGFTIVTFR